MLLPFMASLLPPPPAPTFTGSFISSAGGGSTDDWYEQYIKDPACPPDDPRYPYCPPLEKLGPIPEPPPPQRPRKGPGVPAFVIELLGPGAISFTAGKRLTRFASGKYGRVGGATAAIGGAVGTWLATEGLGKLRIPLRVGAGLASAESLYQMFMEENTKGEVKRIELLAFEQKIRSRSLAVRIVGRQVVMEGKTPGKLVRVLVLQYAADEGEITYFAQEARPFGSDGEIDTAGTLLEKLRRR